jgi:hypothetical protein
MPLYNISNRNGFSSFKSYSSYPDLLVEHLRLEKKINSSSTFQLENIQINI